jgi:hypothetical protein
MIRCPAPVPKWLPYYLKYFYAALSLPHRNIAINDHRVGRWDNAVKDRINQSAATQALTNV